VCSGSFDLSKSSSLKAKGVGKKKRLFLNGRLRGCLYLSYAFIMPGIKPNYFQFEKPIYDQ